MKIFFAIIAFVLFFSACKPGIPKEIIQPKQMEKGLFDIHIVDGYLSNIPKQDSAKIIAAAYYKGIYKKFNIDSALYNKSLNYYYKNPNELNKIYSNVINNLKKQREKIAKLEDVR